eukprot:GFUD01090356.1.p1 GENE.GFUD01090356.1~~GFUD01090356.1.p1  ORF type:complete len:321 (-),score=36.81 GFUD01090356.1:89-1051(-)
MDEFNDLLTKFRQQESGMTEDQAVCARDIRRRGKNKNAAQNCRKRANSRISKMVIVHVIFSNFCLKDKLKEDKKLHKSKKNRLAVENSKLDEQLEKEERLTFELTQRILIDLEMDPKHWTLENDYETHTVRCKKTCPDFDQGKPSPSKPRVFSHQQQEHLQLPRPLPYSRDRIFHPPDTIVHRPIAQVVLEKVTPNHHIQHRPPYYPYGLSYHNQPSVSLFPVLPQAPVSLYQVPRYSIPGTRYGPVGPVGPISLSYERNIHLRDRGDYRRQVEIHPYARTFPPRVRQPEETVIKEETAEDLTVISDKELAIIRERKVTQ